MTTLTIRLIEWSAVVGGLGLALATTSVHAKPLAGNGSDSAALATPPGLRMKIAYVGKKAADEQPALMYTDADNRPLYTYDKDPPGRSTCVGECARTWLPALAPRGARPSGNWSVIKRTGTPELQWAFLHRAVYAFSGDQAKVPSAMGPGGRRQLSSENRANGDGTEGLWHAVLVKPAQYLALPPGFTVAQVAMAPGQALIDATDKTLYLFEGKENEVGTLGGDWVPVAAPFLARPVGNFSVITRADGSYQWAMNRKPLFRYRRDWVLGDANGRAADARMKVALIATYFMPPSVTVQLDQRRGGLLVTADAARKPLYTVDFAWVDPEGGHNTRGARGDPGAGEEIGATGCQGTCEQYWKPLVAPADALPSGFWSLYTRADGTKQWAYQGYALYTFVPDEPGRVNGHDVYRMTVAATTDEPLPPNLGTFWRAVAP